MPKNFKNEKACDLFENLEMVFSACLQDIYRPPVGYTSIDRSNPPTFKSLT
jgi:hypothetical protein